LQKINAVCSLEKIDRSQLVKELIEEGLRERVIRLNRLGKISARKGAEIFEISLREFLQLLEEKGVGINWDSKGIREYLIKSGYLKSIEEIIAALKNLKPTLTKQYGVKTIGVFGSYAKGEQTPKSDIAILRNLQKRSPPRNPRILRTRGISNQTTWHKSRPRNKRFAKTA
jgi:predicted HTH domain antitoxin